MSKSVDKEVDRTRESSVVVDLMPTDVESRQNCIELAEDALEDKTIATGPMPRAIKRATVQWWAGR